VGGTSGEKSQTRHSKKRGLVLGEGSKKNTIRMKEGYQPRERERNSNGSKKGKGKKKTINPGPLLKERSTRKKRRGGL